MLIAALCVHFKAINPLSSRTVVVAGYHFDRLALVNDTNWPHLAVSPVALTASRAA